jgi:AcrR family transcriptional regulator
MPPLKRRLKVGASLGLRSLAEYTSPMLLPLLFGAGPSSTGRSSSPSRQLCIPLLSMGVMRSPRKDSVRSRQAIIAAAEEIFVKNGDANFAEISVLAGLSQATVYRHFRDRSELLVALMSRGLDRLEAKADSWELGPQSFDDLLRLMATEQAKYQGLVADVRRNEVEESAVEELRARTSELFRVPLAAAKEAGGIIGDFDATDVIWVLSMIDGAISLHPTRSAREAAGIRAVDVVLDGIHE